MAYKLHGSGRLRKDLKHVLDSQVKKTLHALEEGDDVHETIHSIRKRFKKIRALWRLIRDDLGEKKYKEKNVFYRDLGRQVSDLRDATAMLETVDRLDDLLGEALRPDWIDRLRNAFEDRRRSVVKEQKPKARLEKITEALKKDAGRINAFSLTEHAPENCTKGMRRVYKRGRKLFLRQREDPSRSGMHQWRKRSKYLRYQYRLLRPFWPLAANARRKTLHQLTDIQGDFQDLTVLAQALESLNALEVKKRNALFGLIEKRQQALYAQAMPLGEKIFAHKPGALQGEMQAWMDASRMEKKLPRLFAIAPMR